MKIEEFRIVKKYNTFQIQRKAKYKERKYFFSKQVEKEDYFPIDILYNPVTKRSINCPPLLNYFETYGAAFHFIERICTPEVIHYPPFNQSFNPPFL